MDYRIGTLRTEEIARKWLTLAERRLAHLDELQRTGRWHRYFSEQSLTAIRTATEQTAREWAALLGPPVMNAPEATMAPPEASEVETVGDDEVHDDGPLHQALT
jgi:hypothetical protein